MRKVIQLIFIVCIFLTMMFVFSACMKLPDNKLMDKAKSFEAEEDFNEAVKHYEKLVENYPGSPFCPEALYRSGIIYSNPLNITAKAINNLTKIIEMYGDTEFAPQSQFMIGFIYANSATDTVKARQAYKAFLDKYPEHELVSSVKWELKYLGKDISDIPLLNKLESGLNE